MAKEIQTLKEEIYLIEMRRKLAELESEEEASILGNSYAGVTIGSKMPKRPVMRSFKPEKRPPTADQYQKMKGKRLEEGMTSFTFKQQRKTYNFPKTENFLLRKEENNTVDLKPEYLKISSLTEFQRQLLSKLSPKHTGEVRAEIEKEFKRLNRTAPISNSIDAVEIKAEASIEIYDVTAKIKWEFLKENVFSKYFSGLNEWNKIYRLLNSDKTEYEILLDLYGVQVASMHGSHIKLIKVGKTRMISVTNSIPSEIFKTFLNGGFICSLTVSGSFISMIKDLEPFSSYYAKTLSLSKAGKKRVTRLEVLSAPPLWQYSFWQSIGEVYEKPPLYYPSIHLFIENPEVEIHIIGNEEIDIDDPNSKRRAEQLRKIKEILGLKIFSMTEDKERMIFLAEEADVNAYVSKELENEEGWLHRQTLLKPAHKGEKAGQCGSSAGPEETANMEE